MKPFLRGFTLIELMVSIALIGILSAIVYANLGSASPKARNADRQADLRSLQNAIEQYKQKVGRYPAMAYSSGDGLSSEADGAIYITGLAPQYITRLPQDTRRGTNLGYTYVTNTAGTSYKIMAYGTVESETVTSAHPMKSCDTTADICDGTCDMGTSLMSRTYALWGGYADGANDAAVKTATAAVICK